MSKRSIKSFVATLAVLLVLGSVCGVCYFAPHIVQRWFVPIYLVFLFAAVAYLVYSIFHDSVFKAD